MLIFRRRKCVSVTLMALVLSVAMLVRNHLIDLTLPYCRHADEQHWASRAIKIIETGDWNPHRFTKPSLQVYTIAGAMMVGLMRSAGQGLTHADEALDPRGGYPFYTNIQGPRTARQVFAFASVAALGLASSVFYRLFRSPLVLFLGPLLALISAKYLSYSWNYLNVDILGVFFAMATVAQLFLSRRGYNPANKAAIAGLLCGLTLGTKYSLFPIIVPCVLYYYLFHRDRWISHSFLILGVMVLSFLVTTPYAIFDLPLFVKQVTYEVHHYATGHRGEPDPAGWVALYNHAMYLVEQLGPVIVAASVGGGVWLWRRDWRSTLVLLMFPVLLTAYMTRQRYFTPHNVLILHVYVPFLAAIGLIRLSRWLAPVLRKRFSQLGLFRAKLASAALVGLVVLVSIPWSSVARAYDTSIESRNELSDWVLANVPRDRKLLLPEQLTIYEQP